MILSLGAVFLFFFFLSGTWMPEPVITPTKKATIVDIGHFTVPDEWGSASCCFIQLDDGENYRFPDYYAPQLTVAKSGDMISYYTEDGRFRFVRHYKQGEPVPVLPWQESSDDAVPEFPRLN